MPQYTVFEPVKTTLDVSVSELASLKKAKALNKVEYVVLEDYKPKVGFTILAGSVIRDEAQAKILLNDKANVSIRAQVNLQPGVKIPESIASRLQQANKPVRVLEDAPVPAVPEKAKK